jgi:hypothetical protein
MVDGADAGNRDAASLGEVAIVHDYLNQRGGAEKVVLELADMWPQAPIYTSLYRPQSTFPEFAGRDVRTTLLDRLPIDRGFRNLFPLYPAAFRLLGEIPGDVVIASSSGWAHMAHVVPSALHVVYCYTLARWLYRSDYLQAGERLAPYVRLIGARLGVRTSTSRSVARCSNGSGSPTASMRAWCTRRSIRVVLPRGRVVSACS